MSMGQLWPCGGGGIVNRNDLAFFGGQPVVTEPLPHFHWPLLGKEEERAVLKVLRAGEISIYGRSGIVADLEDQMARYFGVKYVLSTNSGTAALFAAYFAMNLPEGSEVIVPTYTFPATVTPLLHLPVRIVFSDADPLTGNVTLASIRERVTANTSAIVVTHMWGLPCEMAEILGFCGKRQIRVIEDASHGIGATYHGKLVGTLGDVGCLSLQANKLACAGEGGVLLTNDQAVYERATLVATFRQRPREVVKNPDLLRFWETGLGLKLKIHPLGAAIALEQLAKVPTLIAERHLRLRRLSAMLTEAKGVQPPVDMQGCERGAWYGYKPLFVNDEVHIKDIELYLELLRAEGLDVHKPGTRPLHMTPLFSEVGDNRDRWMDCQGFYRRRPTLSRRSFPGAEAYYRRAISVPTFTTESIELVESYGRAFQKVGEVIAHETI